MSSTYDPSADDLLIAVCIVESDILINTFSPTDSDCFDLEHDNRGWLVNELHTYDVSDWIYTDQTEWGINKATALYGTVVVNDTIVKDFLTWEKEELNGWAIYTAVRDAEEYEETIKHLERAGK